ncbi:MAG: multicopper oxidase domain-containing protein [Planctomycetota bacterium]
MRAKLRCASAAQQLRQRGASESTLLLGLLAAGLISIPVVLSMQGAEEANAGAFEGPNGIHVDPTSGNTLQPGQLTSLNIPSGGYPSPLFGATSYTQKMVMFEEFGTQPMPTTFAEGAVPFPPVANAQSTPQSSDIEAFLSQPMFPACERQSNYTDQNPWRANVEQFLGRPLTAAPREGRPEGEHFAHQRWSEFGPQVCFQSTMTGARTGLGMRDSLQMHGWTSGEFGPGGLYHVSAAGIAASNRGIPIKFHPVMPTQDPLSIWTFDGTLPPKLLMARYGETILFRHHNMLPIDPAANRGFGLHTISTHEHNGHNPAESDGFANGFFFPGQYYDYRWPMAHAGHDSINTDASDPRCGAPDGNGGIINLPGDWRETMSTHWFHDHMLDFTSQNVYKGNAAMMNYYSSIDRGNEAINDGVNLRLPSGSSLDWGNRDYDVNLVIGDKAWDRTGQLWMNPFQNDGFLGDRMLTNWQYHPYLDVRARKYRFRILNGCVARYFKLALVDSRGRPVPFHGIANDGNIMEHAVAFDGTLGTQVGVLPEQSIAERWDIIVDFSRFRPGERLYLVNLLEHNDGRRPERVIPLNDVVRGTYRPVARDTDGDRQLDRWEGGDPCVGKFLEIRVQSYSGTDLSMNPANYVAGRQKMIPLNRPTAAQMANAKHRTFEFGRSGGSDDKPWTVKVDGGPGRGADPRVVSACPQVEALEIWRFVNGGGGWSHPVHVHFEEAIILTRSGRTPPEWERWARKDMFRIGNRIDSSSNVEVAIRIRDFVGTYVEHCHNTTHEDTAMLLRWDSEHPGQTTPIPCPIPSWEGCEYVPTTALPTAHTGDGTGPQR